MAKTKEELNQLAKDVGSLGAKLNELSEDELKTVAGGFIDGVMMRDAKDGVYMLAKAFAGINEAELIQGEIVNNGQASKDGRSINIPDNNGGNFVVHKVD